MDPERKMDHKECPMYFGKGKVETSIITGSSDLVWEKLLRNSSLGQSSNQSNFPRSDHKPIKALERNLIYMDKGTFA